MRAAVLLPMLFLLAAGWPASAAPGDMTAARLDACLESPEGGSTGGQTDCYGAALKGYDARMNTAYARLLRTLPAVAGRDLRASQRAWIAFRDAERRANLAVFSTRQGTLYVPMAADSEMAVTRDRTLTLEAYARVLTIEGP